MAAGEFLAPDTGYPKSLLSNLRSSSSGQCVPQLGSPWRPGSLGNGADPSPGCELLGRWILPPRSNFTRAGYPPNPLPPRSQPPCHNSRDSIVTPGYCDLRRACNLRLGNTQPWGLWHLWGLKFQPPPLRDPPLRDPSLLSQATLFSTPTPRDVGDSSMSRVGPR